MQATVLDVEHLTKRFDGVTAVDDVSFSARRGEILGLLGPNGAGKTTTIQLLLGLTTPTSGAIRLFGLELHRHRREILQRVNFSSAYISLPFNLSVRENLEVFARLYGVRDRRRRIRELLELFEIPEVAGTVIGKLSSGQVTRVNLCKAFLNDPDVLFLDEPTSSLDPDIAEKVRGALKRVQRERGVTIIYTSHNMREVELVCDRVIFLSHGRLVAQGTPREIIEQADTESLEQVFITIAREGDVRRPTAGGD
ncbi:MAG TPA: ABC transporter ATP-binding protein [Thermoanaerobaculia bacterium]|nr:ABC transporter ATP-binding protein [Thermoanaerobaculia bacterium]